MWSPHDDATAITIPRFKLLLDLVGFPIHLWREREVIKAVSRFGVYLGTNQPKIPAELSAWKVAIATDDLCRIPRNIRLSVGGIEYTVPVLSVVWDKGPIYTPSNLPTYPPRFSRPHSRTTQPDMEEDVLNQRPAAHTDIDDNSLTISRKALREICAGIHPDARTPTLMEALIGHRG